MAETFGKKRKTAQISPRSQKRPKLTEAAPPSANAVKVSAVVKFKQSPLIIATTPGLVVPRSVEFTSYAKVDARSSSKARQATAKEYALHSSVHKTVEYTGKEDRPASKDPLRHYVGVFDSTTGQLQVVEARKLVIRGNVRAHQPPPDAMENWIRTQTSTELQKDLKETFGNKKAQKALRVLAENAISNRKPGDSTQQQLRSEDLAQLQSLKETTASMATREELQDAVDSAKPLPKCHADAEEIQDVYLPEEIIGPEVLASIPVRDWQQEIKAGKELQLSSRFVAFRLRRVAAHPEAVRRLRILRYLYWLIQLWGTAKPGRERGTKSFAPVKTLRTKLTSAPEVVIDSLCRKFSDYGVVRKFHQDLVMTHCCVLASILDAFKVDTFDLREDLKLEQKDITRYFKEIGAHVKEQNVDGKTVSLAKLSLPLVFPVMPGRRRPRA